MFIVMHSAGRIMLLQLARLQNQSRARRRGLGGIGNRFHPVRPVRCDVFQVLVSGYRLTKSQISSICNMLSLLEPIAELHVRSMYIGTSRLL